MAPERMLSSFGPRTRILQHQIIVLYVVTVSEGLHLPHWLLQKLCKLHFSATLAHIHNLKFTSDVTLIPNQMTMFKKKGEVPFLLPTWLLI